MIRGREKGVSTGCSGDRKSGKSKKKSAEERRIGDIGDGGDGVGEGSRPTQVNRASLNRKVGSIYGL